MLFEDKQKNRCTVSTQLSIDPHPARLQGPTLVGFNESQEEHQNTVCYAHPESSNRIEIIKEAFRTTGLLEKCKVLTSFLEIDDADLEQSHQKAMVKELLDSEKLSQEEINSMCQKYDSVFMTQVNPHFSKLLH